MGVRNFASKKSPRDQEEIDVGNDDYDEETDEFANYSRSKDGLATDNKQSMKSSTSKKYSTSKRY